MSLSIVAVDKFNPEHIINKPGPSILIDEPLRNIKEKLFLGEYNRHGNQVSLPYFPNLTKIEIKLTNGDYLGVVKSIYSTISEQYNDLPKESVIVYASNIEDEIEDYIDMMYDSNLYDERFKELQADYTDLTLDDFDFVVKHLILEKSKDVVPVPAFTDIVQHYSEKVGNIYNELQEKYKVKNDANLEQFYMKASKVSYPSETIDNLIYTDVSLEVIGNNVLSSKDIFVKVEKLFNIIELDRNIPFVALNKKFTGEKIKEPLVKTYNSILQTVSSKEVKGWILNEKKKLNQATFKIVKGMLFKVKVDSYKEPIFLTVNILPSGVISINMKIEQNKHNIFTLQHIIDVMKKHLDKLLSIINSLDVFSQTKRLCYVDDSKIQLKSIDNAITTNFFINREAFRELLKDKTLSDHSLQLKPTESPSVLSVYYKPTTIYEHSDVKGLTVNIKDNPYSLESSIVSMFSCENVTQTQIIYTMIYILNSLVDTSDNEFDVRKVREKTNKALLKEEGFFFNSKKCQPPRQPMIVDPNSKLDENTIKFKRWTLKCQNESHQYPGFLKDDNIPCCFTNNQVGNESYIRNTNPESLDILVRPSNFKVKINIGESIVETFVIKLVTDDEHYYYVTEKNVLEAITDPKNIQLILNAETKGNLWLETVPLSYIIYPPPTNKCNSRPRLNKKLSSNGFNTIIDFSGVNAPCMNHSKSKIFGYGVNSVPCCYDTERPLYSMREKKETDITKQYILKSPTKLLNYRKIGILPDDISKLFNTVLKQTGMYYRMGIVQSSYSILSAVLLGIDNKIEVDRNNIIVNGVMDFKGIIVKYLKSYPDEFTRLNRGQLMNKFNSLQTYINYIFTGVIYWNDVIDVIEKLLKINILIIDMGVNVIKDTKTKILCRPGHKYDDNNKFLILLKKIYIDEINKTTRDTYELVVNLQQTDNNKNNNLTRSFSVGNKIIDFFMKYNLKSCIEENVYPEAFPYTHLLTPDQVKSRVHKVKNIVGDVNIQVVNDFNKVNFIMTKKNVIIPVQEVSLIEDKNLKIITYKTLITQQKLRTGDDYRKYYKELGISIKGIALSNNKKVQGLLTEFGVFVPIIAADENLNKFTRLDFKYYVDVDEKIKQTTENQNSEYNKFKRQQNDTNNQLFKLKSKISRRIEKSVQRGEITSYVKTVNTSTNLSNYMKIDKIVTLLKELLVGYEITSRIEFLLKIVANEMILDNRENLLLNGIITTQNKGTHIIKRETESILLNLDDIYKWIKTYENI